MLKMEALSILKFWRHQTGGADVISECADALNTATTASTTTDEDETTDDEDSFFDLVFESSKSKFHFVESPRDVLLLSKSNKTRNTNLSTAAPDNNCNNNDKPNSSPVTTQRYPSKIKSFSLNFKESSKNDMKLDQSKRFDRDNSLRSKMMSENNSEITDQQHSTTSVSRYFKMIKPLVSKKGRVTEFLTPFASPVNASPRKLTQSGRVGSFKIINAGRSSGKGRSIFPSSAAASVSAVGCVTAELRRRDDSLLELNDGIQGAILHCKRSYSSSSSTSSSQDCSQLIRSASDPSHEKLIAPGRSSCVEQKRCSI